MDIDRPAIEDLMARHDLSGVVAVGRVGSGAAGAPEPLMVARGLADRANRRPVEPSTRFGTASGTKGFTAVAVATLIEDGLLDWATPAADIVGRDLPDIDVDATVEHLLGHRSGIGDYLDEDALDDIDDHVLGDVSAHLLATPDDYLRLIRGWPQVFPPGERFAYNNGGYVVLALIVERVAPEGYHRRVAERVFDPAGMTASGFFRSDDLPVDVAIGYLADGRTNVFHLPVVGVGDGGAYSSAGDVLAFWHALVAGELVTAATLERMTAWHSGDGDGNGRGYGLGFWLEANGAVPALVGMDAGVSFRSAVDPRSGWAWAVLANTSSGTWPVADRLNQILIDTAGGPTPPV